MTLLSAVGERNEIGKYLEVERQPDPKGRITHKWLVYSKHQDLPLGHIQWFYRWRQYCFYPSEATVYNRDCLLDLSVFLERLKGMF